MLGVADCYWSGTVENSPTGAIRQIYTQGLMVLVLTYIGSVDSDDISNLLDLRQLFRCLRKECYGGASIVRIIWIPRMFDALCQVYYLYQLSIPLVLLMRGSSAYNYRINVDEFSVPKRYFG